MDLNKTYRIEDVDRGRRIQLKQLHPEMDLNKTYGIEDVDRGRRIQLKQLHPEMDLNKPATAKGGRGRKKNSTNAPERTNKQSSTLGPRRPWKGECLRKGITNKQSSNQQPESHPWAEAPAGGGGNTDEKGAD
ncbi:hypothetical protein TNCV_4078251 [Trichonephila clavipes]|nr:hypothetical protein TNCV_4078251 [Trichonephila clavipes]